MALLSCRQATGVEGLCELVRMMHPPLHSSQAGAQAGDESAFVKAAREQVSLMWEQRRVRVAQSTTGAIVAACLRGMQACFPGIQLVHQRPVTASRFPKLFGTGAPF